MRKRWTGFQSLLASSIERFIAYKRALGNQYVSEEMALRLLDSYLRQQGVADIQSITSEFLESFLKSRPRQRARSHNHLIGVVRRFLHWLVIQQIIPRSPLCPHPRRGGAQRLPFIFDAQIAARLLQTAASLPDRNKAPFRGLTYHTMFAVLFTLGLRVGEVCNLLCSDLDLRQQLLSVRRTKFGKSRLVPFGPRMSQLLSRYLESRYGDGHVTESSPLFSFNAGAAINPCTVSQTFHKLIPDLGLNLGPGQQPPCLHQLRHSFAVGTLLRWYRQGVNPADRLIHLSTFMGHVAPSSTAVYLTMTSALLDEASDRFERFANVVPMEVEE